MELRRFLDKYFDTKDFSEDHLFSIFKYTPWLQKSFNGSIKTNEKQELKL
jgi:hypothetical protein